MANPTYPEIPRHGDEAISAILREQITGGVAWYAGRLSTGEFESPGGRVSVERSESPYDGESTYIDLWADIYPDETHHFDISVRHYRDNGRSVPLIVASRERVLQTAEIQDGPAPLSFFDSVKPRMGEFGLHSVAWSLVIAKRIITADYSSRYKAMLSGVGEGELPTPESVSKLHDSSWRGFFQARRVMNAILANPGLAVKFNEAVKGGEGSQ